MSGFAGLVTQTFPKFWKVSSLQILSPLRRDGWRWWWWCSSLHPKFSLFYRQSHSPRNLREACVSRNTRLSLARCVRPTDHQKLGSVSSHPKDKHSFWLQMRISCSNCSQLQRYSTSSVKPEGRTSTHLPPCWGAKPRKSCEETGDEYSMVS